MKVNGAETLAIDVLLVEDSPADVRLTQEAFRDADRSIRLHVVSDGMDAMTFLRREGAHIHAPRPDLILLDLNLPKMNGREVLALIKADENLKAIPTVILTTSVREADIAKSYQLQVNCYLAKPAEWDTFSALMASVINFWLTKVKLPQRVSDSSAKAALPWQETKGNDEEKHEARIDRTSADGGSPGGRQPR